MNHQVRFASIFLLIRSVVSFALAPRWSFDSIVVDQKNQQILANPSMRRKICLFGLSADPPTGRTGHVGIAQALQEQNEWNEVWILPVFRHTFEVRAFAIHIK